jgi:hypothetical protein
MDATKGTVYGLKAVGERIVYVGQTTQRPLTRLARHFYHAKTSAADSPIANWLRTVDPDQVLVVVLDHADVECLVEREEHWIFQLKTMVTAGGLNTRRGNAWESGRPGAADWMPAARMSATANHRRWHVARGVRHPDCSLCA